MKYFIYFEVNDGEYMGKVSVTANAEPVISKNRRSVIVDGLKLTFDEKVVKVVAA